MSLEKVSNTLGMLEINLASMDHKCCKQMFKHTIVTVFVKAIVSTVSRN